MRIKTNYLSVDKQSAINSYGECFIIGNEVRHEEPDAGTAIIKSFELHEEYNEVKAWTEKGFAHLDFIHHLENKN